MLFDKRLSLIPSWKFAALLVVAIAFATFAGERVHFAPRFAAGETFYYRVETRSIVTGKATTPIANPEGESRVSQAISLLVRLDVVGVSQDALGAAQVRFRATYEKSSAQSESDAFNPDEPSLEAQYARAEGHSIEFTLQPDGELTDLNGLADVFPNLSQTDPVLSWAQALTTAGRFPHEGVSIGQKWNTERPLDGVPLSGLFWRTESTYSRDDTCNAAGDTAGKKRPPAAKENRCAVILTHFEIFRRGSSGPDSTPEEYRRNGLRTSGSWTGSGESLDTISLATGFLESSTQTSTQNVDYEIASATTGSRIHQVSQVQSQSETRLVSGPELQP
jgi:hypothetical protein